MAIDITCEHCSKYWTYKGDNKYRATCPDCGGKTKIPKADENEADIV